MSQTHTLPYHDMRGLLALLESQGQLRRITKPVEARYLHTLLAQADTALLMENVEGYSIPVAGGLVGSRQRVALGLGCEQRELGRRFMEALGPSDGSGGGGGRPGPGGGEDRRRGGPHGVAHSLSAPEGTAAPTSRPASRCPRTRPVDATRAATGSCTGPRGKPASTWCRRRTCVSATRPRSSAASRCPSPSPSVPARRSSSPRPTRRRRATTSSRWPAPSTAGRCPW